MKKNNTIWRIPRGVAKKLMCWDSLPKVKVNKDKDGNYIVKIEGSWQSVFGHNEKE